MNTELTSPVRLYDNGPMTIRVGHSYNNCVQYFRDVQNQALEVAAVKLVAAEWPHSAGIVRTLKHRPPKPDTQAQDVRAALEELKGMIARLQATLDIGEASP